MVKRGELMKKLKETVIHARIPKHVIQRKKFYDMKNILESSFKTFNNF